MVNDQYHDENFGHCQQTQPPPPKWMCLRLHMEWEQGRTYNGGPVRHRLISHANSALPVSTVADTINLHPDISHFPS